MLVSIIGTIIVAGIVIQHFLRLKEQKEERIEEEKRLKNENPDTLGLMFTTLSNIGCQPTKNDDGSLSVQYQGENFHMEFAGRYARVWDPMWAGVKADDPDLPKIREAVNSANFSFGPTVVLTAPDRDGVIGIHSRRDIMLHPACPENELFVRAVLDSFFNAKESVHTNFQKLCNCQTNTQTKRRPVGFTADMSNNQTEG